MINIIRGTTPTVKYTFSVVDVHDITAAYLTIEQCGSLIVDKGIDSGTISGNAIYWRLEQEDTLAASCGNAKMMLNWLLSDGTRGASNELGVVFKENQKDEVINEPENP